MSGYFSAQAQIAGPDAGSNYWSVKDSLSLSRGNHWLKVGGEVSSETIVHDTLLDNYGVFSFNGSKTGNAYADFLLGLPATMTQDAPVRKTDNGAYFSLFAQDDYRIHPRLTLNLGLRWQFSPYPYDKYNIMSSFDRKNMAIVLGTDLDTMYKVGATTPALTAPA